MDEITNAILTNPDLLERAQGRDIDYVDTYTTKSGVQMVTLRCGRDYWCIALDNILNDSQSE